jgi:glycosyltransferase involved in cell wall biosynthesis
VIYICIPSYNEAATIGVVLWKIRRVMAEFPRDYQLLVLDDGSTDGTQEVLDPYSRVLPLTVLSNPERRGYAAALERLIREAVSRSTHPRRDTVVVLQADFTEAPEDIPLLVKRIEGGADVVSGALTVPPATAPRTHRWSRIGLGWLFRRRAADPKNVADPLSGFRAYRVAVLKRLLAERNGDPLLSREGWAANAELLLAVGPHARRTDTADVELRYDRRQRKTRFQAWPTIVQTLGVARQAHRRAPPLVEADEA